MDMLKQFGLSDDQALVLFSMQRYLVQADIDLEKNNKLKEKKEEWLSIWEKGIEDLLSNSGDRVVLIKSELALIDKCHSIVQVSGNFKIPLYLILLELSLFVPYYTMDNFKRQIFDWISFDEKINSYNLKRFSDFLDIDDSIIDKYKNSFKKSVRSISGWYTKILIGAGLGAVILTITAGLATPFLAALAAPTGLAGAAAINAGLAALGGGAISAGGFGMAGGICVIVGGGSIFGTLSGMAAGAMFANSSDFALREGAKLEVIMKEIVLIAQKDIRFAQEMIKSQKTAIIKLEEELAKLKFNEEKNKESIKNLAKSIEYLRASLKNSEASLSETLKNMDEKDKEDE
jgi:hypothetical protein